MMESRWVKPENTRKSYILRALDSCFLAVPNIRVLLYFPDVLQYEHLLAGLQKTIDLFPIVAGRLRIYDCIKPEYKSFQSFGSFEEKAGLNRQDSRPTDVDEKPDFRLFSVLEDSKGVLFEHFTLEEKLEMPIEKTLSIHESKFLPGKKVFSSSRQDTFFKARLTILNKGSAILGINVSRAIFDDYSLRMFLQSWSFHTSLSANKTPTLGLLPDATIERDLFMNSDQYFSIGSFGKKGTLFNKKELASCLQSVLAAKLSNESLDYRVRATELRKIQQDILQHNYESDVNLQVKSSKDSDDDESTEGVQELSDVGMDTVQVMDVLEEDIIIGLICYVFQEVAYSKSNLKVYLMANTRGKTNFTKQFYFGNALAIPRLKLLNPSSSGLKSRNMMNTSIVFIHKKIELFKKKKEIMSHEVLAYEELFLKTRPLNNAMLRTLVGVKQNSSLQLSKAVLRGHIERQTYLLNTELSAPEQDNIFHMTFGCSKPCEIFHVAKKSSWRNLVTAFKTTDDMYIVRFNSEQSKLTQIQNIVRDIKLPFELNNA